MDTPESVTLPASVLHLWRACQPDRDLGRYTLDVIQIAIHQTEPGVGTVELCATSGIILVTVRSRNHLIHPAWDGGVWYVPREGARHLTEFPSLHTVQFSPLADERAWTLNAGQIWIGGQTRINSPLRFPDWHQLEAKFANPERLVAEFPTLHPLYHAQLMSTIGRVAGFDDENSCVSPTQYRPRYHYAPLGQPLTPSLMVTIEQDHAISIMGMQLGWGWSMMNTDDSTVAPRETGGDDAG